MQAHDRTASEILRLPDQPGESVRAIWAVFDTVWYRSCYPDAPDGSAEALLEWHLARGQTLGHSPNRYFDEAWQRQAWPGMLALIEAGSIASAFDAWCRDLHTIRAPHWLFDPGEYRNRYPSVTVEVLGETGFINHYHHYLDCGAAEGRIGHRLFDPKIYLASLDPAEVEAAASMPFRHYLHGLESGVPERRTSLLFDPDWYDERYPEAARLVGTGRYGSLLEHYLCNDRPTEFEPSRWFFEAHYLGQNPGLADAIGPNGFRNGFAHFLAHGLAEGRSPDPDLDLDWYSNQDTVQADIAAGRAGDAFVHWITIGCYAGLAGRAPTTIRATKPHAAALYEQRANTILPLLARHKLDFTFVGKPSVTVTIKLRNHFAVAIKSLASLRAQYNGGIQLILIDKTADHLAMQIETHVTGATILRFATTLNDAAAREAGLACATADAILLLGDGIDLAPGAIGNALARLTSDPGIGAVGGRLVQPNGELAEAGGIIWRNGKSQAYARAASPLAAEANFVRDTDFCSTLFLLVRRDVLACLPEQAAGIAGTTHDEADLCTRIHKAGFRVVYEPDALAFITTEQNDKRPSGKAAFVAVHEDYLAGQPEFDPQALVRARSPRQGQTRILFVEDAIPLRHIGSGFVRSNDVLRAMAASGASVTVFAMSENHFPLSAVRAELPDTVEVMHALTVADFPEFIASRRGCYDLIWIARTHNLALLHNALAGQSENELVRPGALADVASLPQQVGQFVTTTVPIDAPNVQPRGLVGLLDHAMSGHDSAPVKIVVDTEAVMSVRQSGQASLLNQNFDLDAALSREFSYFGDAMDVVAVSEAEAAIIRTYHGGSVTVLGHTVAASPTPHRFEERTGMLFVGAIHDMDHPNYDGLAWFIDEVLPLIERVLRWETRLTVVGYIAPGVTLDRFADHRRVTLRGPVADLGPLYNANRVVIAPARFAAGIPYKVHEAAAHGVPVVATTLLASQLGWSDGETIGAAEATDPSGFAERVIALHRDPTLWTRMREAALARIATELDPRVFAARVADLSRNTK